MKVVVCVSQRIFKPIFLPIYRDQLVFPPKLTHPHRRLPRNVLLKVTVDVSSVVNTPESVLGFAKEVQLPLPSSGRGDRLPTPTLTRESSPWSYFCKKTFMVLLSLVYGKPKLKSKSAHHPPQKRGPATNCREGGNHVVNCSG